MTHHSNTGQPILFNPTSFILNMSFINVKNNLKNLTKYSGDPNTVIVGYSKGKSVSNGQTISHEACRARG